MLPHDLIKKGGFAMIKQLMAFLNPLKSSSKGVLETGEDRSAKEVMNTIYKEKRWGGKKHDFYSGIGSHAADIVNPYVKCIVIFLKGFDEKLNVCDLGCGDFNVGKQLVPFTAKYTGVDIVEDLVERNKAQYKEANLEFYCLNIADDELPQGDCVLIRQVLQHLSNADILKVLKKLALYKYVIVTEHIPGGKFVSNKDKRTGQGTRMAKGSGVVLSEPPFSWKPEKERELLRLNFGSKGSQIVTTLYENH